MRPHEHGAPAIFEPRQAVSRLCKWVVKKIGVKVSAFVLLCEKKRKEKKTVNKKKLEEIAARDPTNVPPHALIV